MPSTSDFRLPTSILPPGQQLAAPGKWPAVGERSPRADAGPWRLAVDGLVSDPRQFTLDELLAMPRVEQLIDIHCVTRWSKPGVRFSGVPLARLCDLVRPLAEARYISFVARSERGHSTSLPLIEALALETLIAFEADGQPLAEVHGGPIRTVVPGRYFYKSLKWLERIEFLESDRLGYWEGTAGYHNTADPWREQRYMAPTLSRDEARRLLATRDLSHRDLRSLDAAGHDLTGLMARSALLRDADFRRCRLENACFDGANLSNAHFQQADLRGATFRGADVEGADFAGADLRGADFSGASLFGATFVTDSRSGSSSSAKIDRSTRIDPGSFDDLTPVQAEFVQQHNERNR
jgi:DMSO/TMAO reductase YedYZ molybdopterin-dependent catalytic subunit